MDYHHPIKFPFSIYFLPPHYKFPKIYLYLGRKSFFNHHPAKCPIHFRTIFFSSPTIHLKYAADTVNDSPVLTFLFLFESLP